MSIKTIKADICLFSYEHMWHNKSNSYFTTLNFARIKLLLIVSCQKGRSSEDSLIQRKINEKQLVWVSQICWMSNERVTKNVHKTRNCRKIAAVVLEELEGHIKWEEFKQLVKDRNTRKNPESTRINSFILNSSYTKGSINVFN